MNTLSIALKKICSGIVCLGLLSSTAWADLEADVLALQKQWAEVNYQIAGKEQISAFENLVINADAVVVASSINLARHYQINPRRKKRWARRAGFS